MALFNKLFANRRSPQSKNQEQSTSDKFFAFTKDQVRVVLFRECDFRGRKLLFDSSSVKRVSLSYTKTGEVITTDNEKISEVFNDFGFIYTKPQPDFNQLAEMVFGAVAMSFRGTYFKMHTLEQPQRLMFTQVFSSPLATNSQLRSGISTRSSFEHSKLDYSGGLSTSSLSGRSNISDAILVCRRRYFAEEASTSVTSSFTSLVADSGYSAEHSCYSSSGPMSFSTCGSSLSSESLYKKWLRRASTSLDNSRQALSFSGSLTERKPPLRNSKLGLAFILELTAGREEELILFLMEHIALLESMLWRARQVVEIAHIKSQHFISLLFDMASFSSQYLVNLLSGSHFSMNLWLSLSTGCDNYNSISAFNSFSHNAPESGPSDMFSEFNISRFLKTDPFKLKKSFGGENKTAEKFVQDFCELLEDVDVKATNFFISTLLTAVLTYHLGWVSSCLPSSGILPRNPFNPLWGQFSDLYGAAGHPTKLAQTIITGTVRKDLVSKILISMTYFIRCCDIDRTESIRADVEEENKIIEEICNKSFCIPKENYKKYGDHLREIMKSNPEFFVDCQNNNYSGFKPSVQKLSGLARTQTCLEKLSESGEEKKSTSLYPDLIPESFHLKPIVSFKSYPQLDVAREYLTKAEEANSSSTEQSKSNVVFILGDDDQLVDLKADPKPVRPTFFDLSNQLLEIKDSDFVQNSPSALKPSTSWSQLTKEEDLKKLSDEFAEENYSNKYARSQSEPPEKRKAPDHATKSKFRYAGVKFNLQQYPQILSNYMKSKNLEISNLQFGEKNLKMDELSSLSDTISSRYPALDESYEDGEGFQTPSNASELEFTSDTFVSPSQEAKPEDLKQKAGMKVTNLPMPKSSLQSCAVNPVGYTSSLIRGTCDSYIPDMVLQGPVTPKSAWESKLRNDLALASQHSFIDQPVEEAVAVIANTDTWEVQVMSSHTFIIDKGSSGIRIGMSQLIANMLESLVHMWKLKVPPHYCLLHIEQTLQEFCVRSKALSDLLLATEFCNMEQLTSTLQLEVNDVPLLLAVASTHSPEVTQKYGLSFQ